MEKNIPEFLIKKINEQYNDEEAKFILDGLLKTKKSSFRVNKIKSNITEISEILTKNNINFSRQLEDGFVINGEDEEKVRSLNIYEDGKIYFQSLSSMMPVIVLNPRRKRKYIRYVCCTTVEKLLK